VGGRKNQPGDFFDFFDQRGEGGGRLPPGAAAPGARPPVLARRSPVVPSTPAGMPLEEHADDRGRSTRRRSPARGACPPGRRHRRDRGGARAAADSSHCSRSRPPAWSGAPRAIARWSRPPTSTPAGMLLELENRQPPALEQPGSAPPRARRICHMA
jgi:hypothetical protein